MHLQSDIEERLRSDEAVGVAYFFEYFGGSFKKGGDELFADSYFNVLLEVFIFWVFFDFFDRVAHFF